MPVYKDADTDEILIYHCQACGKVQLEKPNRPAPTCCAEMMVLAAADTEAHLQKLASPRLAPASRKPR